MQYLKNNFLQFKKYNGTVAIFISSFKMWGGVLAETMNILIIIQSESIGDVVKDFIAFGIIAEIDNYLAMSIEIDVDEEAGDLDIKFDKKQLRISDITQMKSYYSKGMKWYMLVFLSIPLSLYNMCSFVY